MSYPDEYNHQAMGTDNDWSSSRFTTEEAERLMKVMDGSPEPRDRERLTHAWRPTVSLLDIVRPSRVQAGKSVTPERAMPVGWILIIAGIVGLILGWVTAPFGIMPV